MSTTAEYIEYVCEQIAGTGQIRYRKMFGEYMAYVNDKPVLLVCDNVVYVKILPELSQLMKNAPRAVPYNGAKEHYVLDIDNKELALSAIEVLERVTPLPKKRKKKSDE